MLAATVSFFNLIKIYFDKNKIGQLKLLLSEKVSGKNEWRNDYRCKLHKTFVKFKSTK